jgi:hypothetical protein
VKYTAAEVAAQLLGAGHDAGRGDTVASGVLVDLAEETALDVAAAAEVIRLVSLASGIVIGMYARAAYIDPQAVIRNMTAALNIAAAPPGSDGL